MKMKWLIVALIGILVLVSLTGLAFAKTNLAEYPIEQKMKDISNRISGSKQDDSYKDMIDIMKKNGYKDMAEAMKKNDYEAMDEFMNNMTDEDFNKMIEIMRANGYEGMAGMMENMGREEMLRMHNSIGGVGGCHAAAGNMMGVN